MIAKTLAELQAELAALVAAEEAGYAKIAHLKKSDRVMNEGGGGYSRFEAECEKIAESYFAKKVALEKQIFEAEWTPQVFEARKAAWNAELAKMPGKITIKHITALGERLGYTHGQLSRAKAMLAAAAV